MNDLIKKISFWLKENSFVASEEKSQLAIFSRNKIKYDTISVYFNGKKLPFQHVIKYLGVLVDIKLKWKYHIEYIKNKMLKSMNEGK